jgi:hypothetical protein
MDEEVFRAYIAEFNAANFERVTEVEVDIETAAERVASELKEASAMVWVSELAAAWARVP